MNKVLSLGLIAFLLVSCYQSSSRKSVGFGSSSQTMEDFAQEVFALIQKDDFALIQNLLPEAEEYRVVIDKSTYSDKEKLEMKEKVQDEFKDNVSELKKSYEEFKDVSS